MRIVTLVCTLLLAAGSGAQVRKVNAPSTVQSIIVFTAGAQVQRTSTVHLPAGRTEVSFTGLSNQLLQQSLQLKADAAVTLLSVQSEKDFFTRRQMDEEERDLRVLGAELTEKIEQGGRMLEVYKREEAMLEKNQAVGGSSGWKAAELKEALDLHRLRLAEVFNKQLEWKNTLSKLQADQNRVQGRLNEIGRKRDSVQMVVVALVESKEARTVTFQLRYGVRDAGWYPTYDIRMNEPGKPLSLVMNANLFQRSGETWKDVRLQLSSGNPDDNATRTELEPWRLGYLDRSVLWEPGPAGQFAGRVVDDQGVPLSGVTVQLKGTRTAVVTDGQGMFRFQNVPAGSVAVFSYVGFAGKEVAARPGQIRVTLQATATHLSEVVVVGYSRSGAEAEPGSERPLPGRNKEEELFPVSTIQYQPTALVYTIEDPYTLETDGKTTTIGIRKLEVPAVYEYYTAPKVDPSVFLTARIPDWQQYDLQSGEASLYVEGTSLGKTFLDLSTTGDTLSLSLGKDHGIKVERRLVRELKASRLIGANRSEARQYEISIRNNKRVPVTLTVQDQFPLSISKDIDVEDRKAPEAMVDKETGLVTWQLTLVPGKEQKQSISYSVRYPKDRRIVLQ